MRIFTIYASILASAAVLGLFASQSGAEIKQIGLALHLYIDAREEVVDDLYNADSQQLDRALEQLYVEMLEDEMRRDEVVWDELLLWLDEELFLEEMLYQAMLEAEQEATGR